MHKRLVSLLVTISFPTVQILPAMAENIHTHMWTPPPMPVQHHTWQSSSTSTASTNSGSSSWHGHSGQSVKTQSTNNDGSSNSSSSQTTGGHLFHNFFNSTNNNPPSHGWLARHNSNNSTTSNITTTSSNVLPPSTHNHSTQLWYNVGLAGSSSSAKSVDLDLSSSTASMTAGHILHNTNVIINLNGTSLTVDQTTKLTPSEYLAVLQVASNGQQSLVLNSNGAATGGSVVIGSRLSAELNSLVIPQGVAVTDLTKSGTLNVAGNISDSGSLYLGSTGHAANTVNLDAKNINVQANGTISDEPAKNSSITSGATALNLSLNAINNIVNAGSIISSGNLSLSAGGSITNALPSSSATTTPTTPTIRANNNVNMVTGTGNVSNSGLIQAANGNINIASSNVHNTINIQSDNGTFQAQNGNINVSDASYVGTANININGGNYLSRNLNLYSGSGTINAITGQINGNLNTQAGTEHLLADTANLNLGNNTVNGDPTFVSTGNITITGLNTFTENLAIIAEGNITAANNSAAIVDTGYSVVLIAGASVNTTGTSNSGTTIIPTSTQNISGSTGSGNGTGSFTATVNLSAPTGGNIDFTHSNAATAISTSGGAVTLLAGANGAGTGNIWFNSATTSIDTSNAAGAGGSVLVVAGGNGGNAFTGQINQAIQLGNIVTGGTPGGALQIYAAAPAVSGGGTATFNQGGTTTSTFIPAGGTSTTILTASASITTGTITTSGVGGAGSSTGAGAVGGNAGNVTIAGAGSIRTNSVEAFGGGGGADDGYYQGGAGGTGGIITLKSTSGGIAVTGDLNSSGGGGGGYTSSGGAAGNIQINSNSALTISGIVLAASGGQGSYGGGGSFGGGGGGAGNGGFANGDGSGGGGGSFGGGGGGGFSFGAGNGGNGGNGGGNFGGEGGSGSSSGALGIGAGGGGGGFGGNSNGGDGGNGSFGAGGPGGTTASSQADFGSGGTFSGIPYGGNAGSSFSNGGQIQLTGQTVAISGTITGGTTAGFQGQSVNAQGGGGAITITTTGAGSSFVVGASPSPGGSAGSLTATSSIIINGVSAGSGSPLIVNSGTFDTQTSSPVVPIVPKSASQVVPISLSPIVPISISESTASSPNSYAKSLLLYELLSQQLRTNQQNILFEQIGTRIATDYTPWTTYYMQPFLYPHALTGGISINELRENAQALFAASEFNADELNALSHAGIVFGPQSGNNFFDLVKGFVLFMPNQNIQVRTREGLVNIPKGTVAWIMETGSDAAIYDFHDSFHTGPVEVNANNKEFTLAPGKELLLTRNNTAEFADLNPGNSLGYRNVGSKNLGSGIKAYICDFSIDHGLTSIPIMHSLLTSKDTAQRKAVHTMLKNAAILADLTGYPKYQH